MDRFSVSGWNLSISLHGLFQSRRETTAFAKSLRFHCLARTGLLFRPRTPKGSRPMTCPCAEGRQVGRGRPDGWESGLVALEGSMRCETTIA